MLELSCLDSTATTLGFLDPSIAPTFLYYAYFPVIIISIILGLFILGQNNKHHIRNKLFFTLTIVYSLHLLNEIIQWIAVPASIIHFSWSMIIVFYIAITTLLVLLTRTFATKKIVGSVELAIISLITIPILLSLPTEINIRSLDLVNCHGVTGVTETYVFILMYSGLVYLAFLFIKYFKHRETRFVALGSFLALALLLGADNVSEYFEVFEFNLFGPVGMLLMLSAIAYLLTEFGAFGAKVAATKVLVVAMTLLIVSEVFVVEGTSGYILIAVTGTLSIVGGYLLVKSVDREIKQKEELQVVTNNLEKSNARLRALDKQKSEFVSIASHQLRSPLTAMRGYASMMVEGSYGPVTEKQHQVLEQIINSGKMMASSIEDYLSISRIESGNMKYEISEFNLKELTRNLVEELQPEAAKVGLILHFASEVDGEGVVNADKGKVYQIIHNLVNNSLKYTPKGTVTVLVKDDEVNKNIIVQISDTGIGMNPATIAKLFEKFSRAENANSVNIKGTGLGLYVARSLAHAMKGEVDADSEGDNKGSTFTFTIPYVR